MITVFLITCSMRVLRKSRNERNETEATPTKLQVPHKRIIACVFSPVLWLAPSLGSVSEVRLMLFSVYSCCGSYFLM